MNLFVVNEQRTDGSWSFVRFFCNFSTRIIQKQISACMLYTQGDTTLVEMVWEIVLYTQTDTTSVEKGLENHVWKNEKVQSIYRYRSEYILQVGENPFLSHLWNACFREWDSRLHP
jgi:hypothetical protein